MKVLGFLFLAISLCGSAAHASVTVGEGQCVPDTVTSSFLCPSSGNYCIVSVFFDQDFAAFTDDYLGKDQVSGACDPDDPDPVTVTTSINICCQNGEIVGPAGGSGESCAEVYDVTTVSTQRPKGGKGIVSIHHGSGPRFPNTLFSALSFGLISSFTGDLTDYCCGP